MSNYYSLCVWLARDIVDLAAKLFIILAASEIFDYTQVMTYLYDRL